VPSIIGMQSFFFISGFISTRFLFSFDCRFICRLSNGESGADVYDRMDSFWISLYREFKYEYCLENFVVVGGFISIIVVLPVPGVSGVVVSVFSLLLFIYLFIYFFYFIFYFLLFIYIFYFIFIFIFIFISFIQFVVFF